MKAFVKESNVATALTPRQVPAPVPGEQQILVRIRAVGVGVHDEYFLPPNPTYPYVVGIEAAGVIEAVGAAVARYQPGQRIMFISAQQPAGGTWAEYAVVDDSALIIPLPDAMDFEQAAALPVAGNTALKAMHAAGLQRGGVLFIAGGAGAIGTLLIQLAAASGHAVVASASAVNHQYMTDLGATHVVDYNDADWQRQVRARYPQGVDAAIAVHPGTPAACEDVVKDGGVIVAVSGDQGSPARGIELRQIPYALDVTAALSALAQAVSAGTFQQPDPKVYAFEDGLAALAQVKTRHTRGKIVLALQA